MFNSKHKKMSLTGVWSESISRRQAIKNNFIALAGVRKKKKRGTQIVIQVLLTPDHCGLQQNKIKIDIYSRILQRICRFMFFERVLYMVAFVGEFPNISIRYAKDT